MITLLDQNTINKIAAGEVIERPSAVVKELVENAIDAGATSVTVEIKEGGIRLIRVTDNGSGIRGDDIPLAFLRHSTSKISTVEDLLTIKSLGFRGEALASIASVAQVELLTKLPGELMGSRYLIEGGKEKTLESIGCPEGSTFLVRNLFYNTPARLKFLKSPMTEAGYISDFMERIAISHPEITFRFINNNQVKLSTSGNGQQKDIIYTVYGRDIASNVIPVEWNSEHASIRGFIGKPVLSRGNRNYMNYFINGRYIKSTIINRAIEEAYKPYSMTHRYPFTVLSFSIPSEEIDVNVHPTKMEIRFSKQEEVYHQVYDAVSETLRKREMIPEVTVNEPKKTVVKQNQTMAVREDVSYNHQTPQPDNSKKVPEHGPEPFEVHRIQEEKKAEEQVKEQTKEQTKEQSKEQSNEQTPILKAEQVSLFENKESENKPFLSKENQKEHRIIGQLFDTYWLVEFDSKLFIIDQHAAHEKVLFERTMKQIKNQEFTSQQLNPPVILTLSMNEEEVLKENIANFEKLGFEIEPFGGKEYAVRAVPANLTNLSQKELLIEMIDELTVSTEKENSQLLIDRIASISCKAAVKGNMRLSVMEAKELIDELMTLDNPYHCPHGRPTIISMTKTEIEKKFKRIV